MFASHFAPAPQPSLASHVFGRFFERSASASPMPAGVEAAPAEPLAAEGDEPDLAQRVRELGEW